MGRNVFVSGHQTAAAARERHFARVVKKWGAYYPSTIVEFRQADYLDMALAAGFVERIPGPQPALARRRWRNGQTVRAPGVDD
jgi:hypothetical protein